MSSIFFKLLKNSRDFFLLNKKMSSPIIERYVYVCIAYLSRAFTASFKPRARPSWTKARRRTSWRASSTDICPEVASTATSTSWAMTTSSWSDIYRLNVSFIQMDAFFILLHTFKIIGKEKEILLIFLWPEIAPSTYTQATWISPVRMPTPDLIAPIVSNLDALTLTGTQFLPPFWPLFSRRKPQQAQWTTIIHPTLLQTLLVGPHLL